MATLTSHYRYSHTFVLFIFSFCLTGCQTLPKGDSVSAVNKPPVVLDGPRREILVSDLKFNPASGKIEYTLPEDAYVRIRIGLPDGGPLLRTLIDWERRAPGSHSEIWDKKDASGKIDFGHYPDFMLVIACVSLEKVPEPSAGMIQGYGRSPNFEINFPETAVKAKDDLIIVSDVVPARVLLDKNDKKRLTESKFEIGIYVDTIFLSEDEEGADPYTYRLNTRGFNAGEHILTVNVVSYTGEIGTKSVRFIVQK